VSQVIAGVACPAQLCTRLELPWQILSQELIAYWRKLWRLGYFGRITGQPSGGDRRSASRVGAIGTRPHRPSRYPVITTGSVGPAQFERRSPSLRGLSAGRARRIERAISRAQESSRFRSAIAFRPVDARSAAYKWRQLMPQATDDESAIGREMIWYGKHLNLPPQNVEARTFGRYSIDCAGDAPYAEGVRRKSHFRFPDSSLFLPQVAGPTEGTIRAAPLRSRRCPPSASRAKPVLIPVFSRQIRELPAESGSRVTTRTANYQWLQLLSGADILAKLP
jgi:hypothetical protein